MQSRTEQNFVIAFTSPTMPKWECYELGFHDHRRPFYRNSPSGTQLGHLCVANEPGHVMLLAVLDLSTAFDMGDHENFDQASCTLF